MPANGHIVCVTHVRKLAIREITRGYQEHDGTRGRAQARRGCRPRQTEERWRSPKAARRRARECAARRIIETAQGLIAQRAMARESGSNQKPSIAPRPSLRSPQLRMQAR